MVCDAPRSSKSQENGPFHRNVWQSLYIKISCNVLRCIFQNVGIFSPDFGMIQPFIIRFSNGFQHRDDDLIRFPMICEALDISNYHCSDENIPL